MDKKLITVKIFSILIYIYLEVDERSSKMFDVYKPCPCNSGKKLKFCCHKTSDLIKFPVHECFVGKNWQSEGIGNVIVVRKAFDGSFVAGIFLVDVWFLGVKDAFIKKNLNDGDLRCLCNQIASASDGITKISYEDARSIVLGGLEYAAKFGIQPHRDWSNSNNIIEPNKPFENKFTFGRDGKPFYMAGPYDKDVSASYIKKITAVGGHYVAPADYILDDDDLDVMENILIK